MDDFWHVGCFNYMQMAAAPTQSLPGRCLPRLRHLLSLLMAVTLVLLTQVARGGVSFTNFFSFDTSSGPPYGTLVQGRDGCLYGVSGFTVFKMTLDGALTFLTRFNGTNGIGVWGGLVQGRDGNFYGTTSYGGPEYGYGGIAGAGWGTVFRVTPEGALTTLVSFNCTNGASPMAELLQATDGNFYGTTCVGGQYDDHNANGYGTVFRVTPDGQLTTLVSFNDPGPTGIDSRAGLVQGRDGQLYGTIMRGGGQGCGTIFKISLAGDFTLVAAQDGTNSQPSMSTMVQGPDGSL
jgi:uncharacterized repeat protein (TIGR03803 family)